MEKDAKEYFYHITGWMRTVDGGVLTRSDGGIHTSEHNQTTAAELFTDARKKMENTIKERGETIGALVVTSFTLIPNNL